MTIFLLSVIGIILYSTFRSKRDFFHPTRIYILLYLLLFSVYFLHLTRIQDQWSSTTTMLFWGAVISFVGVGMLVTFYTRHISLLGTQINDLNNVTAQLTNQERSIDWNWFTGVTALICVFFVGSYLYAYMRWGIIPMTSDNPSEDRFLFLSGNMVMGIAGGSGPLVMMLCAEILIVKHTARWQKIAAFIMMVIAFGLFFTLVTRMPLVRSCIYIGVLYHYLKKQISFKVISFFAFLAILFFVFGSVVRVDITGFSELANKMRINLPNKYILFVHPYTYAVNNIWNMDFGFKKFIDGLHQYNISYGFEMFRGLFFYFHINTPLEIAYNFDSLYNESIVKISGLNTVLYVWHFYKDFGVAGVFLVSLFFGTIVHVFYYNTLIHPSHFRITIYGCIVSMIIFSFMIPLWSFWNLYYEIAVLTITHKSLKLI